MNRGLAIPRDCLDISQAYAFQREQGTDRRQRSLTGERWLDEDLGYL